MDNLTGILFSLICFDQVRQDIFGKVREQKHLEPAVDYCQMPVDSLECIQYGFSSIIRLVFKSCIPYTHLLWGLQIWSWRAGVQVFF